MLKLKELRGKKSQTQVAKAVGISQRSYSNYENGITQPDFGTLKKIAEYFNVSIDYLLGAEEKEEKEINHNGILTDVYFQLGKNAQDAGIPPEDIQKLIDLYIKYKKQ